MTNLTVLENSTVFDGFNAELLEGASVVVEGGRIKEVAASRIRQTAANRIDCGGRILMPGLIDAHVHAYSPSFSFFDNDRMPIPLIANHAAAILERMLQSGFTTVRDAAGGDKGLWLAIEQGLIKGPRFFYSGKGISQTGGHGDMRPGDQVEPCSCASYSGSISVVADGVHEVRKAVREELRKGAHQIKIFASGGIVSPNDPIWMPQFTNEEIRAAVYEASTRRTYVMAHCHTDEAVRRCIENGVRSIEHGTVIGDDTARAIVEADAFVVPTLSVMDVIRTHGPKLGLPPMSLDKIKGVYEKTLSSIEVCTKAGVKLGMGSDLLDHKYHVLQGGELRRRGEVNRPIDVLRSATSVNAALLQRAAELGRIAPNAYADLLVLAFDPFKDLAPFEDAANNIPLIMRHGELVKCQL